MIKILILGGGLLQVDTIQCALSRGYEVHVVDADPSAIAFSMDIFSYVHDINDLNFLRRLIKDKCIGGILNPCSEAGLFSVAQLNDEFKFKGYGLNVAHLIGSKIATRKAMLGAGLGVPVFDYNSIYRNINLDLFRTSEKIVVKPDINSGSRGVTVLKKEFSASSFEEAFNNAKRLSKSGLVVVEQFLSGKEYSVEGFVRNNEIEVVAVTEKMILQGENPVEIGHIQPADLEDDTTLEINGYIESIVHLFGLNNTVFHAEIIVSKNEIVLVEIGGRLAGDFISTKLLCVSRGIDLSEVALDILFNVGSDYSLQVSRKSAVFFLTLPKGKIKRFEILQPWSDFNEIEYFNITVGEGSVIKKVESSLDRCGSFILTGKNKYQLKSCFTRIEKNINVTYE